MSHADDLAWATVNVAQRMLKFDPRVCFYCGQRFESGYQRSIHEDRCQGGDGKSDKDVMFQTGEPIDVAWDAILKDRNEDARRRYRESLRAQTGEPEAPSRPEHLQNSILSEEQMNDIDDMVEAGQGDYDEVLSQVAQYTAQFNDSLLHYAAINYAMRVIADSTTDSTTRERTTRYLMQRPKSIDDIAREWLEEEQGITDKIPDTGDTDTQLRDFRVKEAVREAMEEDRDIQDRFQEGEQ